ncbi:hypothetical protein B0H10DRAFT_1818540 [Mycena sp. CBHHK59/15]|nr:hypothetical protein B0H10DRAFT_1818540 [Mycena sp. CBHHK59/15]
MESSVGSAIIIHGTWTNSCPTEETLIDFRELQGEHSGENMAEEVWASLEAYGLQGRIVAFVMDNATNNDTMIEVFEQKCHAQSINFGAIDSRICCMPHTAHLVAIKVSVSYITGFCA